MGYIADRIFPAVLHRVMDNPETEALRRTVLADATGEILEIGFGTGLSLPCYPEGAGRIYGIDPDLRLQRYGRPRLREAVPAFSFMVASAEALPFSGGIFDCVVSEWSLCSIPDLPKALREVRRVLRPSGSFFFVEHGLSPHSLVRGWQHAVTPAWRRVAGGCHLDRVIGDSIRDAGFSVVDLQYFASRVVVRTGSCTVMGRATP